MELKKIPQIKIWADEPIDLKRQKLYRGKFILTQDDKFFAKLFPKDRWDGSKFLHPMILEEMGVPKADSPTVKKEVAGGGKIEVEWISDYIEVRLYGSSSTYGPYLPANIDIGEIEGLIRIMFNSPDTPVLVIPDFKV